MREFAMADARRLVEAGSGFHQHLADALVLHPDPALYHVDELHVAVVIMPVPVRCLARPRTDDVSDRPAARGALDAEVAVLEVSAQPAPREFRGPEVAYGKLPLRALRGPLPGSLAHCFPPSDSRLSTFDFRLSTSVR